MSNAEVVSSVTTGQLGVKAGLKALMQDETKSEVTLGRIWGYATSAGSRINNDGETSEWLNGEFAIERYERKDADGKVLTETGEFRSGKAYLASQLHSMIAPHLYDKDGRSIPGIRLAFDFEIVAKRSNNPAGFTWVYRPLREMGGEIADPLTLMRQEVDKARAAKLVEHKPEADKGKDKGKSEKSGRSEHKQEAGA